VFELTGTSEEIERYLRAVSELGLAEVSRTGIAAMARGVAAF
jgi:acetolactate synthase-1/3 small subunit